MRDEPSHLLVITNDPPIERMIRSTLERLGHRMTLATDAGTAESCLARDAVDLIVCERWLPPFDTFRFLDQVMFDPCRRHIPVIHLAPEGVSADGMTIRAGDEIVLIRPIDRLQLAAAVGRLLERAAIYTHVIRQDPLTKLLNRQSIQNEIERELTRVKRYQCIGGLIFLDLDDFKRVNDRFGHVVGDQTLIYIAGLILANIRNVDLAGRFGGEEFLIYLPETGESGALTLANRLLDLCRAATDGPSGVTIRFSAGVVEAPRDAGDFATLVERADQAMYSAKKQGKGRVVAWRAQCALATAAEA